MQMDSFTDNSVYRLCLRVTQPTVRITYFEDVIATRIGLHEKEYFGLAFNDDTYV